MKELETHKHWKHVKTAGLYLLMGYGHWKGGVNDPGQDNAPVIFARMGEGVADHDVVPATYTVADVKTADAATLQTTQPLEYDARVVGYQGKEDNRVFVRRYEDFFDGRFVKVDEEGKELAKPAPDPMPTPKAKPFADGVV